MRHGIIGIIIGALLTIGGSAHSGSDIGPLVCKQPRLDIRDFSIRAVEAGSSRKLSEARKGVIAALLAHSAAEVFTDKETAEYWVTLVAIESNYLGAVKSSAGAVGIGQMLPAYADDFAKICGLGEIHKSDLADDATSLLLSACYFSYLVDKADGSIALAAVYYNAGASSSSASRARLNLAPTADETQQYLNKIWLTKESLKVKDDL